MKHLLFKITIIILYYIYKIFWYIDQGINYLTHWFYNLENYYYYRKYEKYKLDSNYYINQHTEAEKEIIHLQYNNAFVRKEWKDLPKKIAGKFDRMLRARALKDYKTSDSLRKEIINSDYKIITTKLNGTIIGI